MAIIKNERGLRHLAFKNALSSCDVNECVFVDVCFNCSSASGFSDGWEGFVERGDVIGSIADSIIKYGVPVAAGLDMKCFNHVSRKDHAESVILLH